MNQELIGEARKCLDVARSALQAQQWEKAEKFLIKSIRIYELPEAQELLKAAKSKQSHPEQSHQSHTHPGHHGSHCHKDNQQKAAPGPSSARTAEQPQEPPNYSQEDVKRCKEILAKKDYYEILCIPKDANEDQIKKAYRKLALKFHPDKNKAPNSTEAFKKISQAFACLSNAEKKKIYDEHGTEENFQQRYSHQFEEEYFDANDIFNMFFGFGPTNPQFRQQMYRRQQQQRNHQGQRRGEQQINSPILQLIFQFAPLLFLLFGSLFLTGFTDSAPREVSYNFAYSQSYVYPVQVVSYRLKQTYFINEWAARDLRYDAYRKKKMDERVEEDLIRRVEKQCDEQKRQRTQYIELSKKYQDSPDKYEIYINKAEQVDMQSCMNLKEYRKILKGTTNE